MHSGILGEDQRFEFDERFDVTVVSDQHTRHVSTVAKGVNEQCPDFRSAGTPHSEPGQLRAPLAGSTVATMVSFEPPAINEANGSRTPVLGD